eukprot:TRINITY_DN51413_c0_g1_i2.p1 TRINITY_DN51413_c0_g1~~TRINITY_DN51413_c0_g1_i2.p1  ORF type:complete len:261 (+),score=79.87 TRINITY_DN51413_c0_g1_i2:69-851(+)
MRSDEGLGPNFVPTKDLSLTRADKYKIGIGCVVSLATLVADLNAAANYTSHPDPSWQGWTIVFALLPGFFHCIVQHFTYYEEPNKPLPEDAPIRRREAHPVLVRRAYTIKIWIMYYVVNCFSMRIFAEAYLSHKWQFVTGAFKDARVIQAAVGSMPQMCVQCLVILRSWGEELGDFSFGPTIVALCLAALNIMTVPAGSPCFEDDDRVVVEMEQRMSKLSLFSGLGMSDMSIGSGDQPTRTSTLRSALSFRSDRSSNSNN